MKKKYFFGILICLVLLCGGVFLLSFDEKVTTISPTHTPEISNAVSCKATFVTYGRPTFGCDLSYQFTFTFLKYIIFIPTEKDYNSSGSISKDKNTTVIGIGQTMDDPNKGTLIRTKFKITNISVTPWDAIVCTRYNGVEFNHTVEQDASSSPTIDIYYKGEISLNKSQGSGGSDSVSYNYYNYSINRIDLPKRTGYTFQGYYTEQNGRGTKIINADGTSTHYGNTAGNPPVRYISTLYAHWERTDCGININLKYPNGTEGYGNCGLFDITYDNGKTVSDLSNEERENGATLRLPIGKKWTIKNIRPAEGLKFDRIVCTQGLTCSNKGNGVYEFSIDKSKVNTDNDLEIDIYMQYLYKININFYKLNKSTENGGTFDLYKQPSGGSETLVGENLTNEPENPYLDNNGKFILKDIKAVENGACVKLTSANVKLKVASGKGKIEIDKNKIIYTANSTGAGSGNGFDNEILIYTAENTLTATLKYQDGATADARRSATYNSNGTSLSLPSPTRTGYRFLGWSLTKNDTGVYYTPESDFNDVVINGKKVSDPNVENLSFNLYAIWQANTYTTTLSDGEGAVTNFADMMITNYNYTYSNNEYCHTVNGVTITYENGTGTLTLNGTPTNAFTIFINTDLSFKQNEEYSVKYTKQEGSMTGETSGCFVLEICDENWANLSTRNHLDFQMNASSGEAKLTVNESGETYGKGLRLWFWYNVNATSARVFNNFKIKITLEKLGENQSVIKTGKVTYDSQLRGVSIPSKYGYNFLGYWDTSATEGGVQYYTSSGTSARIWDKTEDSALYARWEAYNYTLKLNPNYTGGPAVVSNEYTYAPNTSLPSNQFIRKGYIFKGWNTSTNGTGTTYKDQESISNILTEDGQIITLYAQWEETWTNHASSSLKTTEINGVQYSVIASAKDLAYLSKQSISSTLLGKYIQTADIDLSDYTWLPIGSENAFCGEYLGQGHKITGLHTSNAVDANGVYLQTYGGLFGKLGKNATTNQGASVIGVYLSNKTDTTNTYTIYGKYTGGIAGLSNDKSINIEACILENIEINGNTTASFVGTSSAGQIKDCLLISSNISTANATTRGFYTGTMTVKSCYFVENNSATRFTGASSDYSNWVTGVFKYPLPKALIWYPGA